MKRIAVLTGFLLSGAPAFASIEVHQALNQGRAAIDAGRFDAAVQALQAAIPDAAGMPDATEKIRALSAIHFYSAVAFHRLGNVPKAREELHEFFRFSPAMTTIDQSKFDGRFVALFNEVARKARQPSTSFDSRYPGFREGSAARPRDRGIASWSDSAESHFLATPDEKREWRRLREDSDRMRFVDTFWARRDPTPDTPENEFRDTILARSAFADLAWGTEQTRGSLTDRGRVFVLLGKPQVIRLKGQTRSEGATIESGSRAIVDGTVERWVYAKTQLPKLPQVEVVFKFITEKGYGDHVMQKDFFQLKALAEASKLHDGTRNKVSE